MTTFLVNAAGVALIAVIIWWFWVPRTGGGVRASGGALDVVVEGGVYSPDRIEVSAGQPLTLRFLRRDPSACAAQVVFGELDLSAELPVGRPREVVLPPLAPGEYGFTCQMGMYRGKLVVRG